MAAIRQHQFEEALAERKARLMEYLAKDPRKALFVPEDIHDAVYSYITAGGKTLRPCLLLLSCGAVGGDERSALPAAMAVELFHTWTMVHDDIMDRDEFRRGHPTVHEDFRRRADGRNGYTPDEAKHYGVSIGIMTAEVQHGWAISLMSEMYDPEKQNADVVIKLIRHLETDILLALVGGQTVDIQNSKVPIESLKEEDVLDVLWRKTGALIQYSGMAGAMIGLNTDDTNHPLVKAVGTFTSECGVAFQLKDDILGIVGDEKKLGKPVGSDIKEGKRTAILTHAFQQASQPERNVLLNVVGNTDALDKDVQEVKELLQALGGVAHAEALAARRIETAMMNLDILPASNHRDLLASWAEYLIGRTY
ncbi:MAG: polyprenyl synthetase family protein [Gemmatimonadota bacterium]|nr:polyprenyl synthetase family protein [Gemmatimonadota bacterium]